MFYVSENSLLQFIKLVTSCRLLDLGRSHSSVRDSNFARAKLQARLAIIGLKKTVCLHASTEP